MLLHGDKAQDSLNTQPLTPPSRASIHRRQGRGAHQPLVGQPSGHLSPGRSKLCLLACTSCSQHHRSPTKPSGEWAGPLDVVCACSYSASCSLTSSIPARIQPQAFTKQDVTLIHRRPSGEDWDFVLRVPGTLVSLAKFPSFSVPFFLLCGLPLACSMATGAVAVCYPPTVMENKARITYFVSVFRLYRLFCVSTMCL